MDRFEIPTSLLPENAEIRYYQPPFFVKYWLEITTVAFIMFLMTLIIIILARQNRMRLQLTRSISENESKLRTILDNVDAYIYMKDATGRYLFANQSLCSFLGLPLDEIISKTDEDLFDKETAKQIIKADDETFGTGNIYKKEETFWPSILNRRQEIQTTKIPLMDEDGVAYALCGISLDITSQKAQEKKLKHIAHYDQLTELPNRILFSDRLQQAMKHADRDKSKITILYFDLDGFKEVNDNYGHSHGDQLLKTIAERTKDAIRSNDTVARLGGDEFIVLLINAKEPEDDLEVIHRLLDSISDPVVVDGNVLSVTASIGVTNYPQNSSIEADLLLRQADQAMYAAKSEGRNRYHFFDSATEKIAVQQEKLFSEISNGLRQNEFRLFYQPKVDLINGDVIGMEALIRWEHPEKGLLPPGAFLPDVEQHSLMIDIDQWVVRESLRQLDSWRKQELALPVSVNASHLYFKQDSLSFIVKEELKKFPDLNASLLELEIVESQALDNLEGVARKIRECQRLGVRFALDDFGTGFSSLTYLKQLPINILKVDSSFVIDMLDDEEDRMILQGILALCEAFNIKVIAEGLETIQHGIELKNMGYRYAQGYGIAKPMPAEEIIDWINSWQAPREWETPSYYLQDSQE